MRATSPEETPSLSRFLSSVDARNPKGDPDILRWQYWENPFGAAISWVWDDDGKIVCHLARIPVPMILAGRVRQGAITVDAATAESHRQLGLFSRLLKAHDAHCCSIGIV